MNFQPAPRSESAEGARVWQFKHREKAKGKPASSPDRKWSGWFDCSFAQVVQSKQLNADTYHDFEYECREIWVPKEQVLEHTEANNAILDKVSAYYDSERFQKDKQDYEERRRAQELGWLGRVVFPWLHRWLGNLPAK